MSSDGLGEIRVFRGKAVVSLGGTRHQIRAKDLFQSSTDPLVTVFNHSHRDAFDEWSRERARQIRVAKRRAPPPDDDRAQALIIFGPRTSGPGEVR